MATETISISLNYHSEDQQDVFQHPARYKIVRAGRRWGKTTGAAIRALELGMGHPGTSQLWVDTTQGNIDRYVDEVFRPRMPSEAYKWRPQKKILALANGSQIVFGSAEKPQNLEGFGYHWVWLNEAGIILRMRPKLWAETIRPMTLEKKAPVVFIGTPKSGAYVYKQLSERAREAPWEAGVQDWVEFHRSTYENPYLTPAEIDELVKGTTEETHQQEIYAEWVESGAGYAVVPYETVRAAVWRKVDISPGFMPKWGVDVAGAGGDRSALAKRCANHLLEPVEVWNFSDTMKLAGVIKDIYDATDPEDRPSDINVDGNGIGKGVYDALRGWGLPARCVMVSEMAAVKDRYFSLRDEIWFLARAWFEEKTCSIPDDHDLIRELTTPLYNPDHGRGRIKVESKYELKKRGSNSPDLADAFVLTFAGGSDRRAPDFRDRYKRRPLFSGSGGTWMSQ